MFLYEQCDTADGRSVEEYNGGKKTVLNRRRKMTHGEGEWHMRNEEMLDLC